jgi:Zn-dependent alcohol dehydrogenase
MGATHTVNLQTSDAREAVMGMTGGYGVDVAFEALGRPATWNAALDILADGGRMVPIGLGAGVQSAEVQINRTVRRSQSIIGSYGARTRVDLPAVVDMAARGLIEVDDVVNQVFSLDDVNLGYERLRAGTMSGRGIVDMSL